VSGPAVSRSAQPARCPRCRGQVLAGLDADRCGLPTVVEPVPLSNVGEVLALLAGRRTYDVLAGELHERLSAHLRAQPADSGVVVAQHLCNSRPLPARAFPPPLPKLDSSSDEPPF
jgi:hypothetical protein